ncbi:MAG: hypothetical protein M1822_001327 [Bathelium mastoideum]|nr:MAG: hypothetical protein M1822_001327 [Bathelium mastoideum]
MDLPLELHLIIYRHLLLSPQPIDLWPKLPDKSKSRRYHTQSYRASAARAASRHLHVPLLRVCRSIHTHASPVLYSENEFRFTDLDGWIPLSGFLLAIQLHNWRLLRHVTVHVPLPGVLCECPKHVFAAEYDDELALVQARMAKSGLPPPPALLPPRRVCSNAAAFEFCCTAFNHGDALRKLRLVVPANFDARCERVCSKIPHRSHHRSPPSRHSSAMTKTTQQPDALLWWQIADAFPENIVGEDSPSSPPPSYADAVSGGRRYSYAEGKCHHTRRVVERGEEDGRHRSETRRRLRQLQQTLPELEISVVELEAEKTAPVVQHFGQWRKESRYRRKKALRRFVDPQWNSYRTIIHPDGGYDVESEGGRMQNSWNSRHRCCHEMVID